MKILVMGTGGVGGYYGGLLARSGQDVTFVARGEHLTAIQNEGLKIESESSGDFTVNADATDALDGTWFPDLLLFCVKGYDNDTAIDLIRPAVGTDTTVLTLQNGIGSGDRLADAFGSDRVLLGASYVDANRKGPGVVAETGGVARIVFGEPEGGVTPRAQGIHKALTGATIPAELSDDVQQGLWNKYVYICALSGMMCITRSTFAEILDTPETLALTWRVMREVEAVGRAKGVNLPPDVVQSTMATFQETKDGLWSSMRTDLDRGNRLEIGVINGAAARMGVETGVDTPVNSFIAACLTIADDQARQRREGPPA